MFEIQSGKLAAEKAKSEDIKEFGEQMVDDHSQTSEELKELVKDEDIKAELPKQLDQKHQADLDKLKNASGDQFDRIYVSIQVQAHEKAVDLFEDYAQSGDNQELKDWAADTLPALKEHLEEARDLHTKLSESEKTAAADDDVRTNDDNASAEKVPEETDGQDNVTQKTASKPHFKYVTQQEPADWSAQALIGRTVYNPEGDSLGDINNVILNEKGDVVAVTIGVGGFLGMGEKDVGVPFDALQFKAEKHVAKDTALVGEDADPNIGENADRNDRTARQDAESEVDRFDWEHRDIQIVLNATKEQLEKAPDFVWLDERSDR